MVIVVNGRLLITFQEMIEHWRLISYRIPFDIGSVAATPKRIVVVLFDFYNTFNLKH